MNSSSLNRKLGYYGIYFSLYVLVFAVVGFIYRSDNFNEPSITRYFLSYGQIIFPLVLVGMITKSPRSKSQYSFIENLSVLFGLIIVDFVAIYSMNYFNIFDRIISKEDKELGITQLFNKEIFLLILGILILSFKHFRMKKRQPIL